MFLEIGHRNISKILYEYDLSQQYFFLEMHWLSWLELPFFDNQLHRTV